jgi:hypothetical protein
VTTTDKNTTEDTPVSERKLKGPLAVLAALDKHIKAERSLLYEASAREGEEARSISVDLYEALSDLMDSFPGDGDWQKCRDKARAALQRAEGE